MRKKELLSHPSLGELPARQVLECIFALSPTGNILHYHVEQVSTSDLSPAEGEGVRYTLTDHPAAAGRERCRIIPPLVREFDPVGRPDTGRATL
ncbi:MAG: hypothetical protein AB1671_21505 [Thermodesulfobacteriota bacterium]|jgi:hypothetical protein